MRQIVLDTETTGIGHENGHKIIEIGCVELVNRKLTGKHFHVYLNPQREVDEGAFKVHGISTEFLKDKPLFADILSEMLQFIGGAELIIHNAAFDVGFLNAELQHAKWKKKLQDYCNILDTLVLARNKHPGQRNSLDALCKRYDIDNSNRQLHGALLDAEILAHVYLAMTGGQTSLFEETESMVTAVQSVVKNEKNLQLTNALLIKASEEELTAHDEFIAFLEKKSGTTYWSEG
ncbi:MAG: DNA polymerase III subunit epsilon [Legionella sp.]|nr:MAG: DNA polymerase III subunit epsilon [Legionella sp.]PJD99205.1 MAG: DNA polymerase III subunit epsilon [Legionella sp.]